MNGASSGAGNPALGPKAEDIDSVLSRFQDWAKTRNGEPASKYGAAASTGRGTAPRKANLGGGVRELSYEQALRASSYRRQAHPGAGEISSQALNPQPTATPPAVLPELDSPTNPRQAVAVSAKSGRPRETIAAAESTPVTSARSRVPKIETGGVAANISRTRNPTPKSPVPVGKRQPAQPAFGHVLKGTAGLSSTATAVLATKSVALSLRVSDAEQARILACAARANLSVSAYLRQCALGVDELRDQVELTLAQFQKQDAKSASPPGLSAIPGILGHFTARLFRRLRGHDDYTAISLR